MSGRIGTDNPIAEESSGAGKDCSSAAQRLSMISPLLLLLSLFLLLSFSFLFSSTEEDVLLPGRLKIRLGSRSISGQLLTLL